MRFGDIAFVDLAAPSTDAADGDVSQRPALVAQTRRLMQQVKEALAASGLDFSNVLKSTTYYVGDDTEDDLYANLKVRDGYYDHPGPASTGVPFLFLDRGEARLAVSLMLDASHLS